MQMLGISVSISKIEDNFLHSYAETNTLYMQRDLISGFKQKTEVGVSFFLPIQLLEVNVIFETTMTENIYIKCMVISFLLFR